MNLSYPGCHFIATAHSEDEDLKIADILKGILKNYPNSDLCYWQEMGGLSEFPHTYASFEKFLIDRAIRREDTTETILRFVDTENTSNIKYLLEIHFNQLLRKSGILSEDIEIDILGNFNKPETSLVLENWESDHSVKIKIEAPDFKNSLLSLRSNLAKHLFNFCLLQKDSEKRILGYYKKSLLLRFESSMRRDGKISRSIIQEHFLNDQDLQIIPRGAAHELFLVPLLRDKRIKCEVYNATTEYYLNVPYLWYQSYLSDVNYSTSEEGERFLKVGIMIDILVSKHNLADIGRPLDAITKAFDLSYDKVSDWLNSMLSKGLKSHKEIFLFTLNFLQG